jgi:YjbE family integral membrane protein
MAANKLPPDLRKKAIFWGTFGAVAIRFLCVAVITYLLMIPGLRLVGGMLLVWIGWKLAFEQHDESGVEAKTTLWAAISTIIVADAVMGVDNALGIAAAAGGNFWLVIFGLVISVPIIVFGSTLVSKILERFPDSVFVGSFVLFGVAVQMIEKEPLLAGWFANATSWLITVLPWAVAVVLTAVQYNKARLGLHKKFLFTPKN